MTRTKELHRTLGPIALAFGLVGACSGSEQGPSSTTATTATTATSSSSATSGNTTAGSGGASAGNSASVTGSGGNTGSTVGSTSDVGTVGAGGTTGPTAGAGGSSTSGTGGAPEAGGGGALVDAGSDASSGLDQMPWRKINVTAPAAIYRHTFKPAQADPLSTQENETQYAALDMTRPVLGAKLLVDVAHGAPELVDYFVRTGFHVLAVDFKGVNEVPDIIAAGAQNPDNYGNIRLEALEGIDHTPLISVDYHNSFEGHLVEGLKFLAKTYPEEDWGYYLNQDGTVRYSDIILTGQSHGASSVARLGMVRRIYRIVSTSGPRDNSCGTDTTCAKGVIATWIKEAPNSKTPIDRFYAMAGTMDEEYPEIIYAMNALGYVGKPTDVNQVEAPYGGSHRLIAVDGHVRFCTNTKYKAACNYMFGVPPQNQ